MADIQKAVEDVLRKKREKAGKQKQALLKVSDLTKPC